MLRSILGIVGRVAIAIAYLPFTLSGASAEPQCDTRENVTSVLSEKYKESPDSAGVTANGGMLEVWRSDGGETWSIIVSTPRGMSCLVAAGEGWRRAPMPVHEDPAL